MQNSVQRQFTYPTLGEILKYVFDVSGVLANKDRREAGQVGRSKLTGTDAKTIQKQLQRLAEENGSLQPQLDSLLKIIAEELSHYISCPAMDLCLTDLFNDLYEMYTHALKNYATFMPKSLTVQNLISAFAVRTAVLSWTQQNFLISFMNRADPRPADPYWFLPGIEGGEYVTPLYNVLVWAYEACSCTPSQFHRPSGLKDPAPHLSRNLDTSRKWKRLSKRGMPSQADLSRNLTQSFESLQEAGIRVDEQLQKAILTYAAIARITTHIAQDIEKAYGRGYLIETCNQIKLYAGWLEPGLQAMRNEVDEFYLSKRMPHLSPEQNKVRLATMAWMKFSDQYSEVRRFVHSNRAVDGTYNPLCIAWAEKQNGPFMARVDHDSFDRMVLDKPPKFDALMREAMTLRQNGAISLGKIAALEQRMDAAGVSCRVPWVAHWLRAVVYYHADQFELAADHYVLAFDLGKYSAGDYQYKLLNQYLEIMAKTNRWLPFK